MPLNPRQCEAVAHGEGPLLILAGAGSGKTRVLVHRIARVLEAEAAAPWEILAVTFTNKAARELVERCTALVGDAAADLWVGTFHGLCARLLRRHAELLGYKTRFTIYDTDDQIRLIKELIVDLRVSDASFRPEALRGFIDAAKNEGLGPNEMARRRADPFGVKAVELYREYQRRLQRLGAMDFGDLIVNVLRLFDQFPEVLARYQRQFRFVLVDEYQDTNRAQYLMVSRLAAGHGNLCVVGDDDQSIYGWRGADLRNILEFERDFPGARTIFLDQNYRSTATIIKAADGVIANNRGRHDKHMWTDNPAGTPITLYCAADERDEAAYLVDRVRALGAPTAGSDPQPASRVAVFYRTNAQSRAIEEALIHANLRYTIVGGVRFYERREIKDLIAYLRFLHNPDDDLSLARIINVPARGIGRISWDRLLARAAQDGGSAWATIESGVGLSEASPAVRARIERFGEMVRAWVRRADERVSPVLERVIDDTGYVEYLRNTSSEDATSRIENLQELLTVAQNFDGAYDRRELDDEEPDVGPLANFLEQVALQSEVDAYRGDPAVVTLMTVHNSKGLEFPYVFMAGMEEGIFPHARSTGEDLSGVEEERRLAYVGMTRAMQELTLLHARRRHVFGATQYNPLSRFVEEIPAELVVRRESTRPSVTAGVSFSNPDRSGFGEELASQARENPAGTYKVGMKVVHPLFGLGTVRRSDGSGEAEKLIVQFQRVGVKKLVARYAKLEIV